MAAMAAVVECGVATAVSRVEQAGAVEAPKALAVPEAAALLVVGGLVEAR